MPARPAPKKKAAVAIDSSSSQSSTKYDIIEKGAIVQQLQVSGIKEKEFCKRWKASSKKPLSISTLTEWTKQPTVIRFIAYAKDKDMIINELNKEVTSLKAKMVEFENDNRSMKENLEKISQVVVKTETSEKLEKSVQTEEEAVNTRKMTDEEDNDVTFGLNKSTEKIQKKMA